MSVSNTPRFPQKTLDAQQAKYLGSVHIGRHPGLAAIAEGCDTAGRVAACLVRRRGTLETERALRVTASGRRVQALAARSIERCLHIANEGFVSELQAQAWQEEPIDLGKHSQVSQRSAATQRQTELAHIYLESKQS